MKKLLFVALGLSFACNTSQKTISQQIEPVKTIANPQIYAETITEAELKEHLYVYASDEFEGRDTGEPGQKLAVEYLKKEYVELDIPAAQSNGNYFQNVPLIINRLPKGSVTINKTNYENGITLSFQQHGASGAAAYIADNSSTPADYVDPVNASNSIAAMSTITIAWDAAATNEEKLEKIITQKWIAMFPEGQEAWSEYRRTGYPKIFPVVSNQSGGVVDTDIQIRRIPFVDSEKSTNATGVTGAVSLLGGADNAGTRLWWDTGASNF